MEKFINGLLNNISNKGRYGDTTLRNVGGEISHVNPNEAHAIDTYGLLGQYATQLVGSGTINPNTGLREYHGKITDMIPGKGHYHQLQPDGETYVERNDENRPEGEIEHYETAEQAGRTADLPDISTAKLSEYIDPDTGKVRVGMESAFATYMRTVNPDYNRKADDGTPLWTDADIIDNYYEKGPSPFADKEDIGLARQAYETTAEGARATAYESRMTADKGGGSVFRPGQSGFGGTDTKISEGLYTDIGTAHTKFGTDVYGLESGAIEDFGEFVYGATTEDSPYYKY